MAVIVARGVEFVRVGADQAAIGFQHLPRADEFVVAFKLSVVGIVRIVAEVAGGDFGVVQFNRRFGIAAVIGEAGMLRPDAAVDHADDHAFAGDPPPHAPPLSVKPRKVGVFSVSSWRSVSGMTRSTSG